MVTKNIPKSSGFTEKTNKFFRGAWSELKKVHWPTKRELVIYTVVVIISALIVMLLIFLLDSFFSTGLKYLFNL